MKMGKEADILLDHGDLGSVPLASAWWLPAGVGGTHCMVRIIKTDDRNESLQVSQPPNASKAQNSLLVSLQTKFPKLVLQLPSFPLLVLNF